MARTARPTRPRRGDRGPWRSIYAAIWDDPDFQRLSPSARLLFMNLRTCEDTGIACLFRYYPDKLVQQSGLDRDSLMLALAELATHRWIEDDGYVLWIRNGLYFDPNISEDNALHRDGVKKLLAKLPKDNEIVRSFCQYYGFPLPDHWKSMPSYMGSCMASGIKETETETDTEPEKEPDTEPETEETTSSAPRARRSAPTADTWTAYSEAYERRYGVTPLRNAPINGMLTYFIKRIPREEAPGVAAHYVQSNYRLYVSAGHAVNLMLRDAEKLWMEWVSGRRVSDSTARLADETQTRGQIAHDLLREAEDQRAQSGNHQGPGGHAGTNGHHPEQGRAASDGRTPERLPRGRGPGRPRTLSTRTPPVDALG